MNRRLFVASSIGAALAACSPIGTALNNNDGFHRALGSAEALSHLAIGTRGMAREYRDADVDAQFRVNGFDTPSDARYAAYRADAFSSYRLIVDGAVKKRLAFTLSNLQKIAQQTQITRHDCVEGWSAIGKWSGVRLSDVLDLAQPNEGAKYVVFRCLDVDPTGTPYYESLDMQQARHPQALLALRLNGKPLDPDHGAPVRLRVPTQLGYKSAKWVRHIEVVSSLGAIFGGSGGYWEDQGYQWYAGI
ncbi:MAG: molybdopterin-dependent oxidoreductase [Candidatus Eremiobacteraeota bacterium]|nr:molybdopterin-dependent oxidoreductase [Candidatus Eremiobacteraeota bacterium]